MDLEKLIVRRAAVLGAGVMGAQIAAHLANADVPVLLFDLAAVDGEPSVIARKAIDGLHKLNPAPFAHNDRAAAITPANYAQHLPRLAECDLVIEAIAERIEWKEDLYRKIEPHLKAGAIIASNTSGLSINRLAETLPAARRPNFCGIHFFNPPRYMRLVELIPAHDTDVAVIDGLESWLVTRLGKGVVRAKDTPNFIANRVGTFAMLAALHHTRRLGLGFDEVDALTGPRIGRPKSATYRTADVVGLDTLAHVIKTMQDTLSTDPWHSHFQVPAWLKVLIDKGVLGQKTRGGIFRKQGKEIQVLDLEDQDYRTSVGAIDDEVAVILKMKDPAKKFAALRATANPQAQFLWSMFRDIFHYAAVQLQNIADNARDVDLAMRWGYGWSEGPFEAWQAAGWRDIAVAIEADIAAGEAMAAVPLPAWVGTRNGVHEAAGSYSAVSGALQPRTTLPVYTRQLFPERVLGEEPDERGTTVWNNEGVRMWTLPLDSRIAIVSFKSKMHSLGDEVVEGVLEAIERAERGFDGLVLWHEPPFAVGANLQQVAEACADGKFDLIERAVARFQQASMQLRHAQVPTVAAVQGMALGGGCEFAMHASHRVLALESHIGLVEVGVGLIPGGGGCKEFAVRAADVAARQAGNDPFPYLQNVFQWIAEARVAKSALEARAAGFATAADDVVFNPDELLHVALRRARAQAEAGYRPPLVPRDVRVAGRAGIANLKMMLVNMWEGGMISAHDYRVGKALATALCGGDIEPGSRVDADWLLAVERSEFVALLQTPETQARIRHTLDTGKPLRN